MAKPHHRLLAESLSRVQKLAHKGIVRASDVSRVDRERLVQDEWLTSIIKGWYILKQPSDLKGDSTRWYASFWDFVTLYLQDRFGDDYCLTATSSLDLHTGSTIIPKQLLVMVKKGGSSIINLPFDTSIVIYQETKSFPQEIEVINHLNVMSLPLALYRVSGKFFHDYPQQAEIALKLIEPMVLSRELLKGGNIASASRIIGAYQFLKEDLLAEKLLADLNAAGYKPIPINPFITKQPLLESGLRISSPYAARIRTMWSKMRDRIVELFPQPTGIPKSQSKYFKELAAIYVHDAYNSLSIEGYEVSEELIEQIASGKWEPENSIADQQQINAMAAKGYYQAFQAVKESIKKIFQKANPGEVLRPDIHNWYRELFSPSVKAGIFEAEQLAGFRTHRVFIRGSMHTPLPKDALIDAMDAFFNCLIEEKHAAVGAVLGHFIFAFIHPYMDGNGRLARFIMNVMFASGGYPWTIINLKQRAAYMQALEEASVQQNIEPFALFVYEQMQQRFE